MYIISYSMKGEVVIVHDMRESCNGKIGVSETRFVLNL